MMRIVFKVALPLCGVLLAAVAPRAYAEWDPAQGLWGKTKDSDIRVMTWNVEDGIRSEAPKVQARTAWCALSHILASMQPDILLLQEVGDDGTSGGVDSVEDTITVIQMLFEGGYDTFNGGTEITSWVQKYAPDYNLPYIFPSSATDSYNRNVIVSRFPFSDLNGDEVSQLNDLPRLTADAYQTGGSGGGIRGFAMAEFDLQDEIYRGNLVVGTCHLKAGWGADDLADRIDAAQKIAYYIDYFYNGAGTGISDPYEKIRGAVATSILDDFTPIVWGGDFNEDELTNGRKGPAEWMIFAADMDPGTDGTDRDRSDSVYDQAVHPLNPSERGTQGGGTTSKLDYIAWQDSIAVQRRAFIFNGDTTPSESLPPECDGYSRPSSISSDASDHRPVIFDFIAPLWGDEDGDGDLDLGDYTAFQDCMTGPDGGLPGGCDWADFDSDSDVDAQDFLAFQAAFSGAAS